MTTDPMTTKLIETLLRVVRTPDGSTTLLEQDARACDVYREGDRVVVACIAARESRTKSIDAAELRDPYVLAEFAAQCVPPKPSQPALRR